MLVVGAGGDCIFIFSPLTYLFSFSLSLWDRLDISKEPYNRKITNQPTISKLDNYHVRQNCQKSKKLECRRKLQHSLNEDHQKPKLLMACQNFNYSEKFSKVQLCLKRQHTGSSAHRLPRDNQRDREQKKKKRY